MMTKPFWVWREPLRNWAWTSLTITTSFRTTLEVSRTSVNKWRPWHLTSVISKTAWKRPLKCWTLAKSWILWNPLWLLTVPRYPIWSSVSPNWKNRQRHRLAHSGKPLTPPCRPDWIPLPKICTITTYDSTQQQKCVSVIFYFSFFFTGYHYLTSKCNGTSFCSDSIRKYSPKSRRYPFGSGETGSSAKEHDCDSELRHGTFTSNSNKILWMIITGWLKKPFVDMP